MTSSLLSHQKLTPFLLAAAAWLVSVPADAAELLETKNYSERPLTLTEGTLRIDAGPSDFGYMDFGELNGGRSILSFAHVPGGATFEYTGIGAALGIIDDLEVGTLLLPISYNPAHFGNMEAYLRYRFLSKRFQMAVQGTVQIPTDRRFGMGIGLPMLFQISRDARMDFGLELELMADPFVASIDLPFALAINVADDVFLGPRTGVRIYDMQNLQVPLGFFIGGTVADMLDITGSFNWWNFLNTFPGSDDIDVSSWELKLGLNLFFDVY